MSNTSLLDKIYSDPWGTVYECLRKPCDFDELGRILNELLTKPSNSRDYLVGLELLKALKSQAPPNVFLRVIAHLRDNETLNKILADTEPDKIVDEYIQNYLKGMGLITLLEIYPLLGLREEAVNRVKKLLRISSEKIKDEKSLRELLRAIIYGPLTMLSPSKLYEILEFIRRELPDTPLCLQVKADFLAMIPENYLPKIFEEHMEIIDAMGDLLRNISEKTLLLIEEDVDRAVSIFSEVNLFASRLRRLCEELGRFDLCEKLWKRAGEPLSELYNRIGRLIISLSSNTEE